MQTNERRYFSNPSVFTVSTETSRRLHVHSELKLATAQKGAHSLFATYGRERHEKVVLISDD
jgi:hypothetical protein